MDPSNTALAEFQAREHAQHIAAATLAAATTAYGKPLPSNVQRRIVKAVEALQPALAERNAEREALYDSAKRARLAADTAPAAD